MGEVFKSPYRQPPTPEGLRKIENGTLEWFDIEMYSNFNTGVLEQYFEEKNRTEGFHRSRWTWWKILVGITIGALFAAINQYVGLKIGMVIGGSWYISYLIGMGLYWKPTEINLSSGASTGASMICTGFVFTFPAMYILAYEDNYIETGSFPPMYVPITATIFAGLLGVMYFIIFRRVWLVEDPLPMPTFEAWVQLLDIANDVSVGEAARAKETIKRVSLMGLLSGGFTFLRDFPVMANNHKDIFSSMVKKEDQWVQVSDKHIPILDHLFAGRFFDRGDVHHDYGHYTWVDFQLSPMLVATGWFMRWRAALLVSLGTLFTWFVVVPFAVYHGVPIRIGGHDIDVAQTATLGLGPPAQMAYGQIARIMAVGAILGGGLTGLLKMAPVFKTATADLMKIKSGGVGGTSEYQPGLGWYEWPMSHIIVMTVVTLFGVFLVFLVAGYPGPQVFTLALLLVTLTFFLGAIAVKVMGETSIEPVSGTSFIVLLMLVGVFKIMGTSRTDTVILAIIGTTVFGGAISMSGDIILDFKNSLYIGNRPYQQMRAEILGIIPGAIVAGFFAVIFSEQLAKGELNLIAPQAHAFAFFTMMLVGGDVNLKIFLLGFAIGVFMELVTGMGTAFGLGMYFPLGLAFPLMLGGGLRDLWQTRYFERRAKAENWTERKKTLKLLDTYMLATGLIIGEALVGTIVAIFLFSVRGWV